MLHKVEELKRTTLHVTEEQIRKIEFETRAQYLSQKWFDARRHRRTSSTFGQVRRLSEYVFLGASPDGSVYDPSSPEPYGYLEIKCAFKYQDMDPREAAKKSDFWCSVAGNKLTLKENHPYYSQVQGWMAIGGRPWCDICSYTKVGIYVDRIAFNKNMWETDILPKLVSFYDNCVAPEIISPKHSLGFKLRDLRNEF